ncbi:vicilin Cor a 11.0101-like [Silene latifolia]|uniref:vicilin Cor a 11.0101-like n=1 Tax=Silene latifolia TaxID=37657 RepID=UPI003D77B098
MYTFHGLTAVVGHLRLTINGLKLKTSIWRKTSGDRLQRIFSQQREGIIIRASEEQIRALTHDEGSTKWPFGSKSKRDFSPINLLRQHLKEANEFGRLFEIDTSGHRVLQDFQIAISFANLTQVKDFRIDKRRA